MGEREAAMHTESTQENESLRQVEELLKDAEKRDTFSREWVAMADAVASQAKFQIALENIKLAIDKGRDEGGRAVTEDRMKANNARNDLRKLLVALGNFETKGKEISIPVERQFAQREDFMEAFNIVQKYQSDAETPSADT